MNWWGGYIGIPFVDRGRDRSGADCWGLLRMVYRDRLGIELPTYGEISATDLIKVAAAIEGARDDWVEPEAPREFDAVLIRVRARGWVSHCGVMVGGDRLLHTEKATHAHVQELRDPLIRDRVAGFRRHISLI